MARVFIPNDYHSHELGQAARFGRFVYLTTGVVDRLNIQKITEQCQERIKRAEFDDFLLVCSLPIITAIASCIIMEHTGQVQYLLFSRGRYVLKKLSLEKTKGES